MQGKLHSIETFGAVDGPGIRTVFFMQGCPARCIYCHNPDTWEKNAGNDIDVSYIIKTAMRGRPYHGEDGGVTFSGGEPLLQGNFIAEAIDALHDNDISVAIDTSGTYIDEFSETVISKTDLVLLDIKHTEPEAFRTITAREQNTLHEIISLINKHEKHVWLRQVVLPGINDSEEYMDSLIKIKDSIRFVDKIELLGYHNMGKSKYEKLGMPYKLADMKPMNKDRLAELQTYISK